MLVIFSLKNVKQGHKFELTYLHMLARSCLWVAVNKYQNGTAKVAIKAFNMGRSGNQYVAKVTKLLSSYWRAHLVESCWKVSNISDTNWLRYLFSSPPRSFFRLNRVRKVWNRRSHSRFSSEAIILEFFDRVAMGDRGYFVESCNDAIEVKKIVISFYRLLLFFWHHSENWVFLETVSFHFQCIKWALTLQWCKTLAWKISHTYSLGAIF